MKTIGQVFSEKEQTAAAAAESTKAAVDADAKAKSDQQADMAKHDEVAQDLKLIGKPYVHPDANGMFTIAYSTQMADGTLDYNTEAGVGPDTPIPGTEEPTPPVEPPVEPPTEPPVEPVPPVEPPVEPVPPVEPAPPEGVQISP